jgi:cell division septation protein DedD
METYILLKVGKDKLKAEKREEREGKEVVAAGLEGKYKADELKDHLRQIRDELECKRVMLEIKEAGLNEIEVRGLKILLKEIFEALEMEVIDRPEDDRRPEDDKEEEKEEKKVEPVVELPEPKEIKFHGMDLAEDVKAYPEDDKEEEKEEVEKEEKVEPEEKPAFLEKEEEEIKHVSGWWLVLGIVLIIGLIVGGLLWINKDKDEEPTPEDGQAGIVNQGESTPTEIPVPTATPEPVEPLTEEEKEEMSIQILNGTGIPGRATIARARLENAGWGEVEVDNADNYDYVESEIQVKSGSGGVFTSLKEDMEEYYQVASDSFELSTNSEYDAIVILGEDKE